MKRKCSECEFWDEDRITTGIGLCRIDKPKLFSIVTNRGPMQVTAWPSTKHTDWCGAFEPKESNDGLTQ